MNKILELREKRAKLHNESKAFLENHRGIDGCLSDEDEATYQMMQDDVEKLGKEIERLKRQSEIDMEIDQVSENVIQNDEEVKKNLLAEIEHLRKVIEQMGVKLETYETIICKMIKSFGRDKPWTI